MLIRSDIAAWTLAVQMEWTTNSLTQANSELLRSLRFKLYGYIIATLQSSFC